jgi:Xaa-Pro aminopeptidase
MGCLSLNAAHTYRTRINEAAEQLGITSLGFEEGSLSHKRFLEWEAGLKVKLVPAERLVNNLRAEKDMRKRSPR